LAEVVHNTNDKNAERSLPENENDQAYQGPRVDVREEGPLARHAEFVGHQNSGQDSHSRLRLSRFDQKEKFDKYFGLCI
jgi:hypothetical protein